MKILVVSSYLPYPLINGGNVRLFNLVKEISKNNQITLICEKRPFQTEQDISEFKKYCEKVITVDRKKQWSFTNISKSVFSNQSFLITGHTLSLMKQKIKEELENSNYDLIHVETFYVAQNLPSTSIPVVLVEHNIEYLVYKRFVNKLPAFMRPLLNIDVRKIKREEEESWKRATALVAVSDEEKELMQKIVKDVFVVRNGVDIEKFTIEDSKLKLKESETVLFIGDFKWIQNQNAIKAILDEIWPKIIEENSGLKLWVVGKNMPESLKQRKVKNVFFDENAPGKTEEIYAKSDILLAPIAVGGGTSFKILEAMASGVAVVTTPLGAEGITDSNKELLIGNTSQDLAEGVLKLAHKNDYRINLIKNARKLIENKFGWKNIADDLEYVYSRILK